MLQLRPKQVPLLTGPFPEIKLEVSSIGWDSHKGKGKDIYIFHIPGKDHGLQKQHSKFNKLHFNKQIST